METARPEDDREEPDDGILTFFGPNMASVSLQARTALGSDCLIHSFTPAGPDAERLGAAPGQCVMRAAAAGERVDETQARNPRCGGHWLKKQYGRTDADDAVLPPPPPLPPEEPGAVADWTVSQTGTVFLPPSPSRKKATALPPAAKAVEEPAPRAPAPDVAAGAPEDGAAAPAWVREMVEALARQQRETHRWRERFERDFWSWTAGLGTSFDPAAEGTPPDWALWHELREQGLDEALARSLLAETRATRPAPETLSRETLVPALARRFRVADETPWSADRPRVVAFVGPPGAGKTLSLTKYAFAMRRDGVGRAAILNGDGQRPGAEVQLRNFGHLMDMRVETADTPELLSGRAKDWTGEQLVLVDTPGCSHRSAAELRRLEHYLRTLAPDEIHLVLPATSSAADALDALRAFAGVGADRLLLSKADLPRRPTLAANLAARSEFSGAGGPGWSWIGSGASYHQASLFRAAPETLAALALGAAVIAPDSGRLETPSSVEN